MLVANVRIYEFTWAIDKLINKRNLTNEKILQRFGWSQGTENYCAVVRSIKFWILLFDNGPLNNKQQQQIKKH